MILTSQQLRAAAYIAADELSDKEIAEKIGVTARTLRNWKAADAFREEINRFREEAREAALRIPIASREARIERLNRRWQQIDRVFQERSEDVKHAGVPGFRTGLLAHEEKALGSGEFATITDVFRADTGLLKEEREIAKQAAIEMGQWQEKTDITTGGKPVEGQQVVIYIPSNGRDSATGGTPGSVP